MCLCRTRRKRRRSFQRAAHFIAILCLACGGAGNDGPSTPQPATVATIAVTPGTPSVPIGATVQLTATPKDASGSALTVPVTWRSASTTVATVDATGLVAGVAAGSTTITAAGGGKEGTATVTVIAAPVAVVEVSAGLSHTCAILSDGRLFCWGFNGSGAVGNGGTDPTVLTPVQIGGSLRFRTVSAGQEATCASTLAEGQVYCWGDNKWGKLGDGTTTNHPTPNAFSRRETFRRLSVGVLTACGITSNQELYCWGANTVGQRGTPGLSGPVPDRVGAQSFVQVAVNGNHTCALAGGVSDGPGMPMCMGTNSSGELGTGPDIGAKGTPQATKVGGPFSLITVGDGFSCGLTDQKQAYCWGWNGVGQLGDNSKTDRNTPVPTAVSPNFQSLSAGFRHVCGVATNNIALCWGSNLAGQLGDGTQTDRLTGVEVAGGLRWTSISAGYQHTCAITTSRELYCWGINGTGQLGIGKLGGVITSPAKVSFP